MAAITFAPKRARQNTTSDKRHTRYEMVVCELLPVVAHHSISSLFLTQEEQHDHPTSWTAHYQ
eukprot:scaffold686_cov292-Chaetoceros_neogracile.AAC.2